MKAGRVLLIVLFLGTVALSVINPSWWSGMSVGVVGTVLFFDLGGSYVTRRYQKERQRTARKENVL